MFGITDGRFVPCFFSLSFQITLTAALSTALMPEVNLSTPNATYSIPVGTGAVVLNRPLGDILVEGGCDGPGDCAALVTMDRTLQPRANREAIALFTNFPNLYLVPANVTWVVHGLTVRDGSRRPREHSIDSIARDHGFTHSDIASDHRLLEKIIAGHVATMGSHQTRLRRIELICFLPRGFTTSLCC